MRNPNMCECSFGNPSELGRYFCHYGCLFGTSGEPESYSIHLHISRFLTTTKHMEWYKQLKKAQALSTKSSFTNSSSSALGRWVAMAGIIECTNFDYFAAPHVLHCNAKSLWWGTRTCAIEYSRHWASSGCTLLTRAELSRHRASPRPTWSTCTCLDSSPRLNTRIGSNHTKCNHLLEQRAASRILRLQR